MALLPFAHRAAPGSTYHQKECFYKLPSGLRSRTVTISNGCYSKTISTTVSTFSNGFHRLYSPNAFSPNGDGINDIWYCYDDETTTTSPIAYNAYRYTLEIYNRYGQRIVVKDETTCSSFANGAINWDGNINRKPVPVGVYNYFVIPHNCDHPEGEQVKFGDITILR